MARKKRIGEVNCTCKAYDFPHRLYGGDCVGKRLVAIYWNEQQSLYCQSCSSYEEDFEEGHRCGVLHGGDASYWCPHLADILHREEVPVPKRLKMKNWP